MAGERGRPQSGRPAFVSAPWPGRLPATCAPLPALGDIACVLNLDDTLVREGGQRQPPTLPPPCSFLAPPGPCANRTLRARRLHLHQPCSLLLILLPPRLNLPVCAPQVRRRPKSCAERGAAAAELRERCRLLLSRLRPHGVASGAAAAAPGSLVGSSRGLLTARSLAAVPGAPAAAVAAGGWGLLVVDRATQVGGGAPLCCPPAD